MKNKTAQITKPAIVQPRQPFYRSPVFIFTLKLFIPLAVFYVLYDSLFYRQYVFPPYAELHAQVVGFLLKIANQPVSISGTIVSSPQFSIIIVRGCDVIESTLIFVFAILAFPAPVQAKLKGILWGSLGIHLLNMVRIFSLFLIGVYFPSSFESFHLMWWQTFFLLVVIVGWFIWLRYVIALKTSTHGDKENI